MGVNAEMVKVSLNTSTGSQTFSGVFSFAPKVLLFLPSRLLTPTKTTNLVQSFGAYDGTNNVCVSSEDKDDVSTTDNNRQWFSNRCANHNAAGSGTSRMQFHCISLDALGFTINVDVNAAGAAYPVLVLALGGSDITNAECGAFTLPTTTTPKKIDLAGDFEPTGVILGSAFSASASGVNEADLKWSIGFSDGTNDFCIAFSSTDDVATSQCDRFMSNGHCLAELAQGSPGTITGKTTLDSFDSDGFTIGVDSDPYGSAYNAIYVAIAGIQISCGQFSTLNTISPNPDVIAVDTLAFQPVGLFQINHMDVGIDSVEDDIQYNAGFATGAASEGSLGAQANDGEGTTDTHSTLSEYFVEKNSLNGSVTGQVEFTNFEADGFNLKQIDAATPFICAFMAFGPAAAAAGGSVRLVNGGLLNNELVTGGLLV